MAFLTPGTHLDPPKKYHNFRYRRLQDMIFWVSMLQHLSIDSVTSPYHQSHLNWVHDPAPPPSRRLESKDTVPRSDSRVNSSDPIPRNPLDPFPSASWNNSSMCDPSVPHPSNSVPSNSRRVPRNNNSENEVSAIATRGSSPAPPKKRRMRRRR